MTTVREGRRWLRIGPTGRAKAIRQADKSNPKYWPLRRVKRWVWGMERSKCGGGGDE